jgi:hypothetical protein
MCHLFLRAHTLHNGSKVERCARLYELPIGCAPKKSHFLLSLYHGEHRQMTSEWRRCRRLLIYGIIACHNNFYAIYLGGERARWRSHQKLPPSASHLMRQGGQIEFRSGKKRVVVNFRAEIFYDDSILASDVSLSLSLLIRFITFQID